MANQEHLAIFRTGVEGWNNWRVNNPEIKPDLSGEDLSGIIFCEADCLEIIENNAAESSRFLKESIVIKKNLMGVNFTHTNLSEVNLSRASLIAADLSWANLINAHLAGAILKFARLYEAKLIYADLRCADLEGTRLASANLSFAKLIWTDIREADLKDGNFSQANLTQSNLGEAKALAANFSGATLTGACLENWHYNSATNFDGIICEYVYLKNTQQERRPSSGNFAPGEFTKLFQKAIETVDLIFRNGVDWQAFLISIQQLRVESNDSELSIRAIENKDDGAFVIRVNVPPNADKAEIERYFKRKYQLALKDRDEQYRKLLEGKLKDKDEQIAIYRKHNTDLTEIAKLMAARPIENTAIAMSESTDQSRNINISGGTVNNTGAGAMSLGDISGTVANTINQLPASSESDKPGIKELLEQLQKAIEAEPNLSEEDKAEALEQVKALAEAGKAPQEGAMQKVAKRSTTMLKGIIAGLPEAAKLAVEYAKLLPMITSLFGLG